MEIKWGQRATLANKVTVPHSSCQCVTASSPLASTAKHLSSRHHVTSDRNVYRNLSSDSGGQPNILPLPRTLLSDYGVLKSDVNFGFLS